MADYLDRESTLVGLHSEFVSDDATVRVLTRKVGGTAVVELTEFTPETAKPVSRTRLVGIVRQAAKDHVVKPRAVGVPINDATIVRDRNRLDENGHVTTDRIRVRSMVYVVTAR